MSNAIDFLASLPGPLAELTAIHPTNGKIKGRSFNVKGNAEDRAACETWIADGTAQGYGIYFNVNSLSPRTSWNDPRKAAKENVTVLNALHVDADVSKDIADRAAFAVAKAELLRSIRGMNKPPTIIIDSGNGYGLFWVLRKPVKVTAANLNQLTAVNIALRDAVRAMPGGSADACQNLDRVMRLPFTTNFPNATKIERGCVVVPTDLISDLRDPLLGEVLYSVDDFESAPVVEPPPPVEEPVEAIDIPDNMDLSGRLDPDFAKEIMSGPVNGRTYGDGTRSAFVFYVASDLIRLGFTDGEIVWILTNPLFKVSEHVLDQKQREPVETARKCIRDARAYGAERAPTPEEVFAADPPEEVTPERIKAIEAEDKRARADKNRRRLLVKRFMKETTPSRGTMRLWEKNI